MGLHLGQDPEIGLGQMACHGAGRNGGTASGANALIQPDNVTVLPGFQVVMGNDYIGGLDKSKLHVLIGFLAQVAIMELTGRTGDPESGSGIGGEISRSSRAWCGGIQTEGSVWLCWKMARPCASILSVLLTLPPIITFALAACARRGRQPADSISSAIQYQLPTVSRAAGAPGGNWEQKFRMAPRSWGILPLESVFPSESRTSNWE
jgi:hypothetical protein